MASVKKSYLNSIGSYVPERIMTNADFEKIVDTTDEWITTRTGIKERRIARPDETTSDMAFEASKEALAKSGIEAHELDMIIVGTMSPDYPCPSTACILQDKLGAGTCAAMDLGAACSGFVYAVATAKAFVEAGMYKNILIVAAEKMSIVVDYTDRATCVLFGDGAAAGVVSDTPSGFAIKNVCLGADGSNGLMMMVPAGGSAHPASEQTVKDKMHYFRMNGQEVFKYAIRTMESTAQECIEGAGLTIQDISWLIPHQANSRIIEALAKRSELPAERIYNEVWRYGNTSGSSVAIAMNDLLKEKGVSTGENILLVAFGAGLSWGSLLLETL